VSQHRRQPADDRCPLGQADAELEQEAVNLVGRAGAITNQRFPNAMQGRHRLLRFVARAHEAHTGPTGSLANRLGIAEIVLVPGHERSHQLR